MPIGKIYGAYYGKGGMLILEMEDCGVELGLFVDHAQRQLPHKSQRVKFMVQIKSVFGKILRGVDFMHNTLLFAHYDLKPSNIGLIDQDGTIFDYGECVPTSRKCDHTNRTEEYTPYNYSTKKIQERTKTVDIFAMGVTLLEMLCGKIQQPCIRVESSMINQKRDHNGKHAFGWKL